MSRLSACSRRLATPGALSRLALATLVTNVLIVVTGGVVRLSASGLGCPTWPSCTTSSLTTTSAMGMHGAIEFGNRMFTVVIAVVVVLAVISALAQRPRRGRPVGLALLVLAGIPAQAVLGGLTVLTGLNPWLVAGHLLLSMLVVALAYAFWRSTRPDPDPGRIARENRPVPGSLRRLLLAVGSLSVTVLVLGTVVTGSGPNAGAANAARTGLDPAVMTRIHSGAVFLLVGVSVAAWFTLRTFGLSTTAATVLLVAEAAQGAIGVVQTVTHLPAALVVAHLAGACWVWLASLATVAPLTHQDPTVRTQPSAGAPRPGPPPGTYARRPSPSARR